MIDQIKIGSFLRELRKEKELTQEELSNKTAKKVIIKYAEWGRTAQTWAGPIHHIER